LKAVTGRERRPSRDGPEACAFWRAASVLALFNLLLVAWLLLQPAGPRVSPIVSNVAGFVGPLLVLPLCFGGLWRRGGVRGDLQTDGMRSFAAVRRWVPVLLGMGILSYALGRMVFTYYVWELDRLPPMPSYATIGFQGQYPFLLFGILLLLPARASTGSSRARVVLDGLMIMAVTVTFSWYFFLGPVVQQSEETLLARAFAVSYPLADIVLIGSLLVLALRPGRRALKPAIRLLTLGLILIVITDGIYGYERINGIYVTGGLLDAGWPLGYALVGLGAYIARLAPTGEADETPGDELAADGQRLWPSLLPYALLPAVGLLAVYAWRASAESNLAAGVYVGGGLLVFLVLLRQILTIVENTRLYDRL